MVTRLYQPLVSSTLASPERHHKKFATAVLWAKDLQDMLKKHRIGCHLLPYYVCMLILAFIYKTKSYSYVVEAQK